MLSLNLSRVYFKASSLLTSLNYQLKTKAAKAAFVSDLSQERLA